MPEKKTVRRARKMARQGKAPSTQAGAFIREEIHHVREGKHGARSPRQAIAIGLSKARKAGVRVPQRPGSSSKRSASSRTGASTTRRTRNHPSARRSSAIFHVLEREPRGTASRRALSLQTRSAARRRGPEARHRAALRAVRTKGPMVMRRAARKAAQTRKAV